MFVRVFVSFCGFVYVCFFSLSLWLYEFVSVFESVCECVVGFVKVYLIVCEFVIVCE